MNVLRQCLALAMGLLVCASGSHAFVHSRSGVRHTPLRSPSTPSVSHKARHVVILRGGSFEGAAVDGAVDAGVSDGDEAVGGGTEAAIKLGLVQATNYGFIASSHFFKMPQIARVLRAKSVVGLAPASIYAEVVLFASRLMYHMLMRNPFRAYGESAVVLIQTLMMVGLLWRSPGGGLLGRTAIVIGSIVSSLLCFQYLPENRWGLLVVVSTPTIVMTHLPQIWKNFRQKHTGELAGLTVLLSLLGSSVRIGMTITILGAHPWLLTNYGLGALSNALMLFQMYIYRAKTATIRQKVAQRTEKRPA